MSNKLIKTIRSSSLSLTSLVFTGLIFLGCLYFYIALSLPDVVQLKDAHMQVPLRVYTKDGKLIAEFGEKKRIPVTIDEVPPLLIRAILDTEDQRFYEHRGVDFFGLARAGIAVIGSGRKTQGASTITMQVARNFFLSPEKTYWRKINEILLAFKIDRSFGKKEVLELYLNKIYLGQRAYGVAAASYVYFGKPLNQLTLPQLALIAGLPQAPSRDNPLANPAGALERRNHVLARMFDNKHITTAQYNAAIDAPLGISHHGLQVEVEAPYLAEMVRNALVAQFGDSAYEEGYKVYTTIDSQQQNAANQALRNGLMAYEERHGYRGPEGHLKGPPPTAINAGTPIGAHSYTNLNANAYANHSWQNQLRQIPIYGELLPAAVLETDATSIRALLWSGETITVPSDGFKWALHNKTPQEVFVTGNVIRVHKMADGSWRLAQLPQIAGALVSLDTNSGAVLSLIGGFSYAMSNFNRAVQADRQTGSTFKPFLYSAALAKGYTLASVINDSPISIEVPGSNTIWQPQNDNQRFYGPTRLKVALIKSRNVVSVRLLQAIGIHYAVDYIKGFGFDASEIPAVPSLALGVAAISPLKMAAGYAVFANGGFKITPYFIDNIEHDNKIIFKANPARAIETTGETTGATTEKAAKETTVFPASRVITPQNAYLMTSAMKDVIHYGTARKATVLKRADLAGKTGTTNDQVDAWFAGYNRDVIAVAWVGYDNPKSIYEHGAQAALPIWIEFIEQILRGKPEHDFKQPDGMTIAQIDPRTGLLAVTGQKNAISEIFTDDTVPTEETSMDSANNAVNADENNDILIPGEDDDVGISMGDSNATKSSKISVPLF